MYQRTNMRIGEISRSAEYRIKKELKIFPTFRARFRFAELKPESGFHHEIHLKNLWFIY